MAGAMLNAGGGASASSSLRSGRLNTKLSSLTSFASPCGPAYTTRHAPAQALLAPPAAPGANAPLADFTGRLAPSTQAAPNMKSPPRTKHSASSREIFESDFIRFGVESATGVPRPQRRILAGFVGGAWSRGRKLRGFSTTALCAWLLFGRANGADAEPAARFADVPATVTPAPPVAPPVVSRPVAPTPPPAAIVPPVAAPPNEGWSRRLARSHFERGEEEERRGDIPQVHVPPRTRRRSTAKRHRRTRDRASRSPRPPRARRRDRSHYRARRQT